MSNSLFGGDLIECRNCHEEISSDAKLCPHCGENQQPIKFFGATSVECRNCHQEISTDAKICPHCGERQEPIKLFGASSVECRNCNESISSDAQICPHCGEDQVPLKLFGATAVQCRNCGEKISSDADICPNCGENQRPIKLFGASSVECRTCGRAFSSDALDCPHCGDPQSGRYSRSTSAKAYTPAKTRQDRESESDNAEVLIKWGIYIALFFGAVWLAFAIVLPLVILNAALVSLVCGFIWREQAKIFFAIALAGIVYLLLDIDYHGLSASLMARAVFFQTMIAICVYVNIAAALVAAYLLFRIAPGHNANEFSKRNLIVLAITGVAGIALILTNIFLLNRNRYVIASTAPVYSAPAPLKTAAVGTAPQPATVINSGTPDSTKITDSTRVAADAALATANMQLDTNMVKSDLIGKIGNLQYSDQLSSVSQIQSIDIRDRVNTPGGLSFHALLTFNSARHGQVEMTYLFSNGILSFSTARLTELTKLITVPADGWTRILAPVGFVMNFRDDSRMYWKAYEGGQVYKSGADVGPLTLPASNEYLVSSRGDGPLAFDVVFTPAN